MFNYCEFKPLLNRKLYYFKNRTFTHNTSETSAVGDQKRKQRVC